MFQVNVTAFVTFIGVRSYQHSTKINLSIVVTDKTNLCPVSNSDVNDYSTVSRTIFI